MPFTIERRDGPRVLREEVAGNTLRIGRGTQADLRFDDTAVALDHAIIERQGEGYLLTDRGSVTGTYVGGKKVEQAALADGDTIEIGGFRLRVAWPGPEAPLGLEVSAIVEETAEPAEPAAAALEAVQAAAGGAPLEAPRVDYAGAYALKRGVVSRAGLSAVLAATVVLVILGIALAGRATAFRPGQLTREHAGEIGRFDCARCHQPWRGPVDERCVDCHQSHPVHQPTQVTTPPCGGCHTEHRGLESTITRVADELCVDCHGELQVTAGEPRFARAITGFAANHPELAIDVAGNGAPRRLRLDEEGARRSDPTALRLNHRLHLDDARMRRNGYEPLGCDSCHLPAEGGEHFLAVDFDLHCRRCHGLSFDPALADREAPHEAPNVVRGYLIEEYGASDEWKRLSPRERVQRIIRGRVRDLERSPALAEKVTRAERYLYGTACRQCHLIDETGRLPAVAPPNVPTDWLPHARFPHDEHRVSLECADCHAAADSAETADVLLPGIATCRRCHGETAGDDRERPIRSACADCHDYHGGPGLAPVSVAQAP